MRVWKRVLLFVTIVVAFGSTGGIAWANWTTGGAIGRAHVRAARIPIMNAPRVEMLGNGPRVTWTSVAQHLADHYVVSRMVGDRRAVICRVTVDQTSCRDHDAVAGTMVEYSVYATLGAHWLGQPSRPSDPLSLPSVDRPTPTATASTMTTSGPSPAPATNEAPAAAPTAPVQADDSPAAALSDPATPEKSADAPPAASTPDAAATDPVPAETPTSTGAN